MNARRRSGGDKGKINEAFVDEKDKDIRSLHGDMELQSPLGFDPEDVYNDQPIYMGGGSTSVKSQSQFPKIFTELHTLQFNKNSKTNCWINNSRWIVYEETYNGDKRCFERPSLSAISIKGLQFFRTLFKKGYVSFGDTSKNYLDVLNLCFNTTTQSNLYSADELLQIKGMLESNHFPSGTNLEAIYVDKPMFQYNESKKCFEPNENFTLPMSRKRNVSSVVLSDSAHKIHSQKKLSDCLSLGTEALLIQAGSSEHLHESYLIFLRLEQFFFDPGLLDTLCPIKFIMILFGPKSHEDDLIEAGRALSVMMSSQIFREFAYKSNSRDELLDAMKKFVDNSVLVHVKKRFSMETLANLQPKLKHYIFLKNKHRHGLEMIEEKEEEKTGDSGTAEEKGDGKITDLEKPQPDDSKSKTKISVLRQFWPPFHQLYIDIKGMRTRYISDFKDAFTKENAPILFSGLIFVYFVILSPALTFGALLNSQVTPDMTITMLLISSGVFQFVYSLFAGQPLEIVGVTPTVYVVEQILAQLSKMLNIQLFVMRFWIGIYMSGIGIIFLLINGPIIIKHFRRSVEEVYNTYYSIIFILSSLFTMFRALPTCTSTANSTCPSLIGNLTDILILERFNFGKGGTTLFMALIMLNLCLYLVKINRGIYLRTLSRKLLGAFNVPLGIILVVAVNYIFFQAYQMPMLNIPPSNVINLSLWIKIPSFPEITKASSSAHGFCFLIAASMFFMLLVEVSTNSICVTKAERKLKKLTLYSVNYLLILVFFPVISVFLGWPFFSGAMVRSNAHCIAMAKWSVNDAPGVPRRVLGEVEQRISGLIASILVFVSVFLGTILRLIPMASMYGMFLYMGVMGVSDMLLWRRLINLLKRRKHWRERYYLEGLPHWHIRTLVIIQLLFVIILIILYILSQFTVNVWTLFLFPPFVGIYAMLRGYALPRVPKLNTHLSKMDKKHAVVLYDGHSKPKADIKIIVDEPKEESLNDSEEEDMVY